MMLFSKKKNLCLSIIWCFQYNLLLSKGSLEKKTIESLTAGGQRVGGHNYFFPCSKTICVPPGSPKIYLVFTPNSMYHIFSKLFDSQDFWSHLTWPDLTSILSKVVGLLVRVFMVKISLNFNKICCMPYSTTPPLFENVQKEAAFFSRWLP